MKSQRPREVFCPLLKRKFKEELCTDAILVAEDFHPERFAPEEICVTSNWKDICKACRNNPYNENN